MISISYWDIRLWLAANAIILLLTSELLLDDRAFQIHKKRFRFASLILSATFLVTVLLQVLQTSTLLR